MVLTIAQLGRTNVAGNRLSVALKLTPDAAWEGTAGEALDLTTYVSNIETVHVESTGGYVFSYDRANKKLIAYEASSDGTALDAVGTTNLSALSIYLTVTGGRA